MNVFIVIGSDGYLGDDIEGVFLTLEEAVNKAGRANRIEEHSTTTNEWVAIYSTDGELINENG